jgi:hypothetical protein
MPYLITMKYPQVRGFFLNEQQAKMGIRPISVAYFEPRCVLSLGDLAIQLIFIPEKIRRGHIVSGQIDNGLAFTREVWIRA